jgi:hypothetical protein
MRNGHVPLRESLAAARASLAPPPARSAAFDPLLIDLPPLGTGFAPSAAGLRHFSALYLQAELEQTGIVPVVELLAHEWSSLDVRSATSAQRLEDFSRRSGDWLDRDARDRLFARVFGLGRLAAEDGGVNRDFENRFAAMCLAIVRYGDGYRFGERPSAAREAGLRHAAGSLLGNLAPRESGAIASSARRIQEQLELAVKILGDPEIGILLGGRGLWDTLRRILGPDAPDVARFADRARNGQRLLLWLADAHARLLAPADPQPLLDPQAAAIGFAAAWLEASGVGLAPAGTVA